MHGPLNVKIWLLTAPILRKLKANSQQYLYLILIACTEFQRWAIVVTAGRDSYEVPF
jgi:hypothetical protein